MKEQGVRLNFIYGRTLMSAWIETESNGKMSRRSCVALS